MIKSLYISFFCLLSVSCRGQTTAENVYSARNDIRFGKRFFSILINEDSSAMVIKGTGTYYTEPLQVESADTSTVFTLDSANIYFKYLNNLKAQPIFDSNRSDAPRIEIYYNQKKVYDSYYWREPFWDMFRPIMQQLPKEFSPFRVSEKPFG